MTGYGIYEHPCRAPPGPQRGICDGQGKNFAHGCRQRSIVFGGSRGLCPRPGKNRMRRIRERHRLYPGDGISGYAGQQGTVGPNGRRAGLSSGAELCRGGTDAGAGAQDRAGAGGKTSARPISGRHCDASQYTLPAQPYRMGFGGDGHRPEIPQQRQNLLYRGAR